LAPLTEADAASVAGWRYDGRYAIYDGRDAERALLLDPANRYLAIHEEGRGFIGHVCLGVEARVPGLGASEGVDDVGVGLDPAVMGRGRSRWLLPRVLEALALAGELHGPVLRVAVAEWNERAQAAARIAGFGAAGRHENKRGGYVLMTRAWP
jgi:hypothetical protein